MIAASGIFEMFNVSTDDQDLRLDAFLTGRESVSLSRSQIRKAIDRGEVFVNGVAASKAGHKLRLGEVVECRIKGPDLPNLIPQDIPLEIIHEDEDVLIIVKPAGMVVHPAPGHPDGTLVNALLHHCQKLSRPKDGEGQSLRPGIVHRLDKDTSGVMVVARSDRAMRTLAEQFAAHTIDRRYLALAWAKHLDEEGSFDTGHGRHPRDRKRFTGQGRRRAVTHFEVLERFTSGAGLLACRLETGRTHQIRVHLREAGAPIIGDKVYGTVQSKTKHIGRQALHAELLGFLHPSGERVIFSCPPPSDFQGAVDALRAGKAL